MKKGLIFTVLLMGVLALGFSRTDNSWTVNNTATWIEAVNGIRNGGNDKIYRITVNGNVSIPPSTEFTFGSVDDLTVYIEGSGTLSSSSNGVLLSVGTNQAIVVKDITLRGRPNNGSYSVVTVMNEGRFHMEGNASITGNTINGSGGGVRVEGGTFYMTDNASVTGNTATLGGGVYVKGNYNRKGGIFNPDYELTGGTFLMDGGTVSNNTSSSTKSENPYDLNTYSSCGGGVYMEGGAFLMRSGGTISGNTNATNSDDGSAGGGVYVGSTREGGGIFIMMEGTISNNTTTYRGGVQRSARGGGVAVNNGTFTMQGGTISGNTASATSTSWGLTLGGGVYNGGTFTMQGGTISGNTAAVAPGSNLGGGVYNVGTFTMQNGLISGNTASNGGGVYVPRGQSSGSFDMQGGTISGNTANIDGGGIYMGNLFTIQGNASVSGNTAVGNGGGVYFRGAYYGDEPFTMKDSASVSGNTASGNGGGLYIMHDEIFVMQDNASISGNTAIGNGGGIYFNGKSFTKTGGTIYGDDEDRNLKNTVIGGRGNAVYEAKAGGWRNTTAGLTMNTNSYGFLLNEGEAIAVKFPSGFFGVWKRNDFSNTLTLTENTVKSSSSDYVWVLTRISGDTYTMRRSGATNTLTIKITYRESWSVWGTQYPATLSVEGDSGSGQNNWNGTWSKQ